MRQHLSNTSREALRTIKAEYRADKAGVVHMAIGKVNFTTEQLEENFKAALHAVIKAKPSAAKGKYIKSVTISTTMGPGVKIDPSHAKDFETAAG